MAKGTEMGKHGLLLSSSFWLENTSNKENKGRKVDWDHIVQGLT